MASTESRIRRLARRSALALLGGALRLRFRRVRWIAPEALAGWIIRGGGAQAPLLLDTRQFEEFEVSHLEGARQTDLSRALSVVGHETPGRAVVVYCSVGYRSGRVAQHLASAGVERVYNLAGGIFVWADQGRPLVADACGDTQHVHPFNGLWGLLLPSFLRGRPLQRGTAVE